MVSAHERIPSVIGGLCDLLEAGIRQQNPGLTTSVSKSCCSMGKPVFAYVQHTKIHLTVYLRCEESDRPELESLLNNHASLSISEREHRNSRWEKVTPYFLRINASEEAEAATPLLVYLSQRAQHRRKQRVFTLPSENEEAVHWEGNKVNIRVDRYERDPKARAACIRIFGVSCAVCNLNFAREYGEIGEGFIHVHHLNPLSSIGKKRRVDPKNDLRPVCPNCHEMLHTRKPEPLTIEELKEALRNRASHRPDFP